MMEEHLTWVKSIKDGGVVPCVKVCFNGGVFGSRCKVLSSSLGP